MSFHLVDENEAAIDQSPPSAPAIEEVTVRRGRGGSGCGGSSCDDIGGINIWLEAADDRTAAAEMGYDIELVDGELPAGLALPEQPVRSSGGALYFHWGDGATDDQEAISFTLRIRALDRGGNVGPPVDVPIADGGSWGCRVGPASEALVVGLLIAGGLVLARRRYRVSRTSPR